MRKLLCVLSALILSLLGQRVYSQGALSQIVEAVPAFIDVCGPPGSFQLTMTAGAADAISNTVRIQLPAGVRYVLGSVNVVGAGTATEIAPVDITAPAFQLSNIPAGQSLVITYLMEGGCDLIDAQISLQNTILFTSNGASDNPVLSTVYNAHQPAFTRTNQTNIPFTNGIVGQTFIRSVTLQNSGLGAVNSFTLFDTSGKGILVFNRISSAGSIVINTHTALGNDTVTSYTVSFTDGRFDPGETVIITESVTILACTDLNSRLGLDYGCFGNCTKSKIGGGFRSITIQLSAQPNLVLTRTRGSTVDFKCKFNAAVPDTILIVNNGTAAATNAEIALFSTLQSGVIPKQSFYSNTYIDTTTVKISINGGAFVSLPANHMGPLNSASRGNCAAGLANSIKFLLAQVNAGDIIRVAFERYYCPDFGCGSSTLRYVEGLADSLRYSGQCQSNTITTVPATLYTYQTFEVASRIDNYPSDINNGEKRPFSFYIDNVSVSGGLADNTGYISLEFKVGAGLTFSGSAADISFQPLTGPAIPVQNLSISGDTVKAQILISQLSPVTWGSLSKARAIIQLTADCNAGSGAKTVSFSILGFPTGACISGYRFCASAVENTTIHCPSPCPNGGMAITSFNVLRANLGLADNNNNGSPDGTIDSSLIRFDRIVVGDTINFIATGRVVTGPTTFSNGIFRLRANASNFAVVNTPATITITRGGTTFSCTSNVIRSGDSVSVDFSLPQLAACSYLDYQNNDVFRVAFQLKATVNVSSATDFQFVPQFFLSPSATGARFQCDQFSGHITQIYTYYTSDSKLTTPAVGCNQMVFESRFYMSIGDCCNNYDNSNAFEFEYRPFSTPGIYTISLPAGIALDSARFKWNKPPSNTLSYATISPFINFTGNTLTFNAGQLFTANNPPGLLPAADEGWSGFLTIYAKISCNTPASGTIADRFSSIGLPGADPFFTKSGLGKLLDAETGDTLAADPQSTLSFSAVIPEITVQPVNPVIEVNNVPGQVQWDIQVSNSSTTANAGNFWIADDGSFNGTVIIRVDSIISAGGAVIGPTITPVGSIYRLGNINALRTRYFRITASYSTCPTDLLGLGYGWNCSAYPADLGSAVCSTIQPLSVNIGSPDLVAVILLQNAAPQPLCVDSAYQVMIVNQLPDQFAKNVSLNIDAPPGFAITVGTSEVVYKGITYPIEPTQVGAVYTWNISAAVPGILNGGLRADSNTAIINFRGGPVNCNFASGFKLLAKAVWQTNCGNNTFSGLQTSQPIKIIGDPDDENTYILRNSITPMNFCQTEPGTGVMRYSLTNNGIKNSSSVEESIDLTVPKGYRIRANTYVNIHNAITATTPIITPLADETIYTWTMPDGIIPGDSVVFTFELEPDGSEANNICSPGEVEIIAEVTREFNASCGALNCNIKSIRGADFDELQLIKFGLTPLLVTTSFSQGTVTGQIVVANTGSLALSATDHFDVGLYSDENQNGQFDSSDVKLGTLIAITGPLAVGAQATINYSISSVPDSLRINPTFLVVGDSSCVCARTILFDDIPLPLKLLSFKVTTSECSNILQWTTANEVDVAIIVLQRMQPGGLFTDIARLAPTGNGGGGPFAYEFIDNQVSGGIAFLYRLRMVDINGKTEYSPTIRAAINQCQNLIVNVNPNPFNSFIDLHVLTATAVRINYSLINTVGACVRRGEINVSGPAQSDQRINNLGGIASGMYILKINSSDRKLFSSIKLVKQ